MTTCVLGFIVNATGGESLTFHQMTLFHFFHSNNTIAFINDHFIVSVTTLTYTVVKSIVEFLESTGSTNLVNKTHTYRITIIKEAGNYWYIHKMNVCLK